jgi:hypothetical protein
MVLGGWFSSHKKTKKKKAATLDQSVTLLEGLTAEE